jgi:hypothetical protein
MPEITEHADMLRSREETMAKIQAGDRVTILVPNGIGRHGVEYKQKTGRAVMRGPAGWVLNMGGAHGTPGVATVKNFFDLKRNGRRVR